MFVSVSYNMFQGQCIEKDSQWLHVSGDLPMIQRNVISIYLVYFFLGSINTSTLEDSLLALLKQNGTLKGQMARH